MRNVRKIPSRLGLLDLAIPPTLNTDKDIGYLGFTQAPFQHRKILSLP